MTTIIIIRERHKSGVHTMCGRTGASVIYVAGYKNTRWISGAEVGSQERAWDRKLEDQSGNG